MKWIFRIVCVFLALAVLLVGVVFVLPADKMARIAADQIAASTGRTMAINGDVSLTLWPVLGVSVNDIEFGNAEWSEQEPMLQAVSAAIGVDALRLLSGEIAITKIEAHSPTIRLEQKRDGRANWQFSEDRGDASKGDVKKEATPVRNAGAISIARLSVTDATLIYEAEGSDRVALKNVDLALDWPDPEGPADVSVALQPGGTPVVIALVVDTFGRFIAGEVSPLRAGIDTAAGQISLDGRASIDGSVAGMVSLKTENTNSFLAAFGLPAVDFPAKMGRSIDATTDLTLTADLQLALRKLRVDLGGNTVAGDVDVALNGTPQINARLEAGALDLAFASDDKKAAESSGIRTAASRQSSTGWPATPIDASALAGFNGDISLNADSIDLGSFKLGKSSTILRNNNSRAVFELVEVAAYGGQVVGEFVVNNRTGLSVGGKMQASGIQMRSLLSDAVDLNKLTGQGNLQLSFLGAGQTVDGIMRSLSGNGAVAVGQGTIEGINLDQLLRGGASGGTTIFDDLTGTWTIADGILSNQDLLLQLKNYRVSGAGVVGLGEQNLDYRITPLALRANSGNGIAIPVVFKGPWNNFSILPDLEAVLDPQLEEERKELEKRAKEKLKESLGVSKSKGQSTEDALKNKLKRKLFD